MQLQHLYTTKGINPKWNDLKLKCLKTQEIQESSKDGSQAFKYPPQGLKATSNMGQMPNQTLPPSRD